MSKVTRFLPLVLSTLLSLPSLGVNRVFAMMPEAEEGNNEGNNINIIVANNDNDVNNPPQNRGWMDFLKENKGRCFLIGTFIVAVTTMGIFVYNMETGETKIVQKDAVRALANNGGYLCEDDASDSAVGVFTS